MSLIEHTAGNIQYIYKGFDRNDPKLIYYSRFSSVIMSDTTPVITPDGECRAYEAGTLCIYSKNGKDDVLVACYGSYDVMDVMCAHAVLLDSMDVSRSVIKAFKACHRKILRSEETLPLYPAIRLYIRANRGGKNPYGGYIYTSGTYLR